MKLSICVLAGTDPEAVARCLADIAAQSLPFAHEILVASAPGDLQAAALGPEAVPLPATRGAAAALRGAAVRARGEMIALIDPALRPTGSDKLAVQVTWLDSQPGAGGCVHPVAMPHDAVPPGAPAPGAPEPVTAEALLASRAPVPLGSFVLRRNALDGLPDWFEVAEDPGWALAFLLASGGGLWRLPRALATPAVPATAPDGAALAAALVEADAARDALLAERAALRTDLAAARMHPWRALGALLEFRLLAALSHAAPPLPARLAARMANSAAKRDPARSLPPHEMRGSTSGTTRLGASHLVGRQSDPSRPTILLVTHDASRTGAPILALNLCEALAARYNVVVLSLRGGELLALFRAFATEVIVPAHYTRKGAAYTAIVAEAARNHGLRFALVNSLESVGALAPLRAARVPVVSLVHEFAAYTLPRSLFAKVAALSDDTVFSAELTLEDARALGDLPADARLHVVPQGKSRVPPAAEVADAAARDAERAWLGAAMRPVGVVPDPFVVMGAGTVHLRKGLDLFLDCAARIAACPEGKRFRFVWIGHGYAPDSDMAYSAYLADQIRRAGLGRQVVVLRQTAEIEAAYRLADLFLLSSRLDPLPNVAIDALMAGLPVLCFDRTTGIAAHLVEAGLGPDLVAPYLDTAAMAGRIRALARDPVQLQQVRNRCRDLAGRRFDMARYVERIEALADAAVARRAQKV